MPARQQDVCKAFKIKAEIDNIQLKVYRTAAQFLFLIHPASESLMGAKSEQIVDSETFVSMIFSPSFF